MAIYFLKERHQYVIETKDSIYSFFHWEDQLKSAYWGKRIKYVSDIPRRKLSIGECYGDTYINCECYNSEFVGWGSFFYAEPTLKVTFADGVRDLHLKVVDCAIENEHTFIATYKDEVYDMSVQVIYRVYEELNLIDRNCIITNHTGEAIFLNSAASATITFPYRDTDYRLTSMRSYWGHEYDITREPVSKARIVLESRAGISNVSSYPYFAIDEGMATETVGEVWYGTLQWSGNWKITVETDTVKEVRVTGGLNDFDFCYKLEDGASFETPIFTLGYSQEGFSGASRQLHDYTRQYQYDGYWADKCLPVSYSTFGTYGIDGIEEQNLLDIVDRVADLGVELFAVDDGWYSTSYKVHSGLGDWWPSPERFPKGLGCLIKKVNERGMIFGIWIEPEMVTRDSELYRKHPDWVLCAPDREHEPCTIERLILNLAKEEVYRYIISVLDNLLSNNNIGYLKWDMNRWFTPPASVDSKPDEWQNIWVDYVRNLYRLLQYVHTTFPHVILENCSSGGLRADLAMAKYCSCINRSDNQDPVDELYLHEGFTYVNLPRAGGGTAHLTKSGYGYNHRDCPMEFKAHIANMSTLAIDIDIATATEQELEEIKGYITMHKKIRHIVQFGDMYRLASLHEKDYMAMQYITKDKTEALLFLFGPCRTFMESYPDLKLYGLDSEALYSVSHLDSDEKKRDEKFTMHGETLMNYGIPGGIHTRGNMRSVMFYLKKV